MTDIHVVTEGKYSDYRIVQAFTDRGAAEAFTEAYNASEQCTDARVETYAARDAGWVPGEVLSIVTKVALVSGDVIGFAETSGRDWNGEDGGSTWTGDRVRFGRVEIWTVGDAALVPQVHADAVAKRRAEITGL